MSDDPQTGELQEQLDRSNPPAPITPKLRPGELSKEVSAAIAQTGTGVTIFNRHTSNTDKLLEAQAQQIADRIYTIDGDLSRLLGERNDAVAAYERLTGQKVE